jgi:2-isopropylmalate synthase
MDRVYLFDTTLRDGEQSPGATMSPEDRLHIAHLLAQAGVDIIEAGFPAASPIVAKSVAEIARSVRGSQVAALARCTTGDIDIAWESIKEAESPRLHVFIATSDIHIERKLRTTREDVVQRVAANVAYAKSKCNNIEFSAEDATRSDSAFLFEVYATAIRAGATTINVPDTVGYTTPAEMADLVERIIREVPGIENVIVSVHTHDDLGLATANALSAVGAGARRQLRARRSRRRDDDPARPFQGEDGLPQRPHRRTLGGGLTRDRHAGAEKQSDRRRERLRARIGDPSGRHDQRSSHV